MKNTFGTSVSVTLFGESHGETIGAVLDGLCPGIPVDLDFISHQLTLRRPQGENARKEPDDFSIVSGVYNGFTTGAPLTVLMKNTDVRSADYEPLRGVARPSHADYTAYVKYNGYADFRGGGHLSGRLTAPLVAVGAIALSALAQKNIRVGTHLSRLAGVSDRAFADLPADLVSLANAPFPVLDETKKQQMRERIAEAKQDGDSVGGILETAVIGLPAGLGEPWFDSVESLLSHALFSVPAVKGVSFGDGFSFADQKGSEANDAFAVKDGELITLANHNGGINGGITNGMPLLFSAVIKPTPSIRKEQQTANFLNKEPVTVSVTGRHDACILPRAAVVVNSLTALTLCDLLALRFGTDWFTGEIR